MKIVSTNNAPGAIGPYSQAVIAGGMVYTSGQIAIDPATGNMVEGGVKEQTEQVCKNVKALLEASGTSIEKVVKTTCFLADMADFAVFNEITRDTLPASQRAAAWRQKRSPRARLWKWIRFACFNSAHRCGRHLARLQKSRVYVYHAYG